MGMRIITGGNETMSGWIRSNSLIHFEALQHTDGLLVL